MANYNREILVPYLRDVCSVEMLCQKLEREKRNCQGKVSFYETQMKRKVEKMEKPVLIRDILHWLALFLPVGLCAIVISIIKHTMMKNMGPFIYLLGLGLALVIGAIMGFFIAMIIVTPFFTIFEHKSDKEKYLKNIAEMNKIERENVQYRGQLKSRNNELSKINSCLIEARRMRQRVYSVNIIPSRYRSAHVAYYLYDFFNSCRETDLEKVIQTMLLDEIVQRLDKIIAQNEEILINQRYQMALQERQNSLIASNHREQMKRMARMEQNQELQADYLNMIEQNQNVTNFILTMDFLYK